jgi:hypothetical protein
MRSSSPPPRWLRRAAAFVPLTIMTMCPALVFLVRPTLINVLTVSVSVAAAVIGGWVVRRELRADRHATPSMTSRYRALARLLAEGHDREVRHDAEHRVTILLMDDRGERGASRRAILRFDQAELDDAGTNGTGTPVVFEQFTLDHDRAIVRHWFGAVTVTRGADGDARVAGIPEPDQHEVNAAVAGLLDRTGVDLALIPDLDDLINQIRSSVALAP